MRPNLTHHNSINTTQNQVVASRRTEEYLRLLREVVWSLMIDLLVFFSFFLCILVRFPCILYDVGVIHTVTVQE